MVSLLQILLDYLGTGARFILYKQSNKPASCKCECVYFFYETYINQFDPLVFYKTQELNSMFKRLWICPQLQRTFIFLLLIISF